MDDLETDLEVDDLLANTGLKKKVNGKRKGNRVELELCKLLTKRFGKTFTRSVGSGNRFSQVAYMPSHAKDVFSGDICPPDGNFLWVIECKGGYDEDIDTSSLLVEGSSRLNEFIKQSEKDANQSGRKPIICWKRSRKPWIAIVRQSDVPSLQNFKYYIIYQDWVIISLEKMLAFYDNTFWFENYEAADEV